MQTVLWLAAAVMAIATPALAQDKETIQKLNDNFAAAFHRGDYAAVAGMYAEDAQLLPSGAEMMRGRAAIQAFWTKAGEGISEAKLTTLEVAPLGDAAAREIGAFSLKLKGAQPREL